MSDTKRNDHWLEDIIDKILARNTDEIVLSVGKTPSGRIHLGIMRETLICDGLRRKLQSQGKKVKYRIFFDSLDAAKRFPSYIPKEFQKKYVGQPFSLIPNPLTFDPKKDSEQTSVNDDDSYAKAFGGELISTFPEFGIEVEPVWTNNLYKEERMEDMIRIGLKKNDQVKEIVAKFLTASMNDGQRAKYLEQQKTWMGAMVICENCQCTQKKQKDGTISPNRVLSYNEDTDEAQYVCPSCGHEGEVKISSGLVKLNWRLDWPAKWTLFQTTCEPAGKDHCTPGGSYDTGLALCQEIYGYQGPVKVSYEWLRLGDRDMKTSKGIVFTPQKFLEITDAEILKMIIYRTNPNKHISFRVEEMDQYYTEYQRIERVYFGLEDAIDEKEKREIDYIYPLIQVKDVPKSCPMHLPHKFMTVLVQLQPVLGEDGVYKRAVEYMKKENFMNLIPKEDLLKMLKKSSNWIEEVKIVLEEEKDPKKVKQIKNKIEIFSLLPEISDEAKLKITDVQKEALNVFLVLSDEKDIVAYTNEIVKELMMATREKTGISAGKFFKAFYAMFFNASKGPRLGPLMAILEKDWIIRRIKEVL